MAAELVRTLVREREESVGARVERLLPRLPWGVAYPDVCCNQILELLPCDSTWASSEQHKPWKWKPRGDRLSCNILCHGLCSYRDSIQVREALEILHENATIATICLNNSSNICDIDIFNL